MFRTVLIETLNLDEPALRRQIAALAEPLDWRLEPLGRRWLLWLDDSQASERLCGALLGCGWLRRLDFASASQR
jgi:hypothetical protein